jgi:hypothetical protein
MYEKMATEVGKAIVGQHEVIEQLFIAVFARSHCLLEGVPGLAKTAIKSCSITSCWPTIALPTSVAIFSYMLAILRASSASLPLV